MRRTALLSAACLLGVALAKAPGDASTYLRFIHVSPSLGPVDIYLDGQRVVRNLSPGRATAYRGYRLTDAGPRRLKLTLAGQGKALLEGQQSLAQSSASYDFYVYGSATVPKFGSSQGHASDGTAGGETLSFFNATQSALPLSYTLTRPNRTPALLRSTPRALGPYQAVSTSVTDLPATASATLGALKVSYSFKPGDTLTVVAYNDASGALKSLLLSGQIQR